MLHAVACLLQAQPFDRNWLNANPLVLGECCALIMLHIMLFERVYVRVC